jgi:hypothetical protein
MRQIKDKVIIDVMRDSKRTTVSLPVPLYYMDAMTREGGEAETLRMIEDRTSEGRTSSELTYAIGMRVNRGLEALIAAFEEQTGESALPIVSGRRSRDNLKKAIKITAQMPD